MSSIHIDVERWTTRRLSGVILKCEKTRKDAKRHEKTRIDPKRCEKTRCDTTRDIIQCEKTRISLDLGIPLAEFYGSGSDEVQSSVLILVFKKVSISRKISGYLQAERTIFKYCHLSGSDY